MKKNSPKAIFIKTLPLLILYCAVAFWFIKEDLSYGDETRYARDVESILTGQNLSLMSGPLYPLFLAPGKLLGLSWYTLKWFNPFLLYAAVVIAGHSLTYLVKSKTALIATWALGLYVPFLWEMQFLLTEPLALLLISAFAFFSIKTFQTKSNFALVAAGISLAALALTKVLVGYIIVLFLAISFISLILCRNSESKIRRRRAALIFALAFALCIPYLFYTYHVTGRVFYWANTGGENLYWMTNPTTGEYGFWNSEARVMQDDNLSRHHPFCQPLQEKPRLERDSIMFEQAIKNLKQNPTKYFYNWLCNIGRMYFNYPYDYKFQNPATLFYTIPNSLVFWLIIALIYMLIIIRKIPKPTAIRILLYFLAAYWLSQSLSTAGPRKMYLAIPIFVIVLTWTIEQYQRHRVCPAAG